MVISLDVSPLLVRNLSGVGQYGTELFLKLLECNKKHSIDVVAFMPIEKYKLRNQLEILNHPNVNKKILIPMPSRIALKAFTLWQKSDFPALEAILGYSPDVYINLDWYIPPTKRTKVITTVFDLTTVLFPEFHKEKNIQIQKLKLDRLERVSKIITISESARNDLLKYNNRLEGKISVIYPGCKNTISISNFTELDKKFCFNKDFILTVGTLEPRKNLIGLINGFLKVKEKINKKLVIVGGFGWKDSQIAQLIDENKDSLVFLGYVSEEELNYLYNKCHSFAYVSFYEGFGIPPLEAMSVGKYVLVSNTSSLPEVVGSFGIQVNPNSIDEISEGLITLSNKQLTDEERKNIVLYTKKFDYNKSAEKLLSLVDSI